MPPTLLGKFRLVALTEGVSYLVLLLITWPLKLLHVADWPNFVVGMAHGILFLLYCFLLWRVAWTKDWTYRGVGVAFAASLLPTGTFFLDSSLRQELADEDVMAGG